MVYQNSVSLKEAYRVLEVLKANKFVTSAELSSKCNLNSTYVVLAIKLLKAHGYNIESIKGIAGGYIYHTEKRKIQRYKGERVRNRESKHLIELYNDKLKLKDIIEFSNRSKPTIYAQLKKNGLKPDRKRRNIEEYRYIEDMYNKGLSIKEIAKKLNIPDSYANKLIYTFVKGNRRNKINNRDKIKEYILNNKDVTGKEIARKFGISQATVTNLKKEILGIKRNRR